MKTYSLIYPDPECTEQFDLECDLTALEDGGELITCPECEEEWMWEYDPTTDTLILLGDEDLRDCFL